MKDFRPGLPSLYITEHENRDNTNLKLKALLNKHPSSAAYTMLFFFEYIHTYFTLTSAYLIKLCTVVKYASF